MLIEFPVFTACRSCIKVIVVHEMHWKRVGSAGNAKEWATTHFWVSVAIENSDSLLRQSIPHVATKNSKHGMSRVTT